MYILSINVYIKLKSKFYVKNNILVLLKSYVNIAIALRNSFYKNVLKYFNIISECTDKAIYILY